MTPATATTILQGAADFHAFAASLRPCLPCRPRIGDRVRFRGQVCDVIRVNGEQIDLSSRTVAEWVAWTDPRLSPATARTDLDGVAGL